MKRAHSTRLPDCPFVTKGGMKLDFALKRFGVDVSGLMAADFGCHKGGFTDCLLSHGAARVHAVDTGYGILDWTLRNDERVIVHERCNVLHWRNPEPVDLVVIDAGWTRQHLAVPAALNILKPGGVVLALVKPQYEAEKSELKHGVLSPEHLDVVVDRVKTRLEGRAKILDQVTSPYLGSGGNTEVWWRLSCPAGCS